MVLGASNLWFSVTASALHLPQSQTVADIVSAHWALLGEQPNATVTIVRGQKGCRSGECRRPQTPPRDPGHRDARFGELTSTHHKNVTTAEKELVVPPEDG